MTFAKIILIAILLTFIVGCGEAERFDSITPEKDVIVRDRSTIVITASPDSGSYREAGSTSQTTVTVTNSLRNSMTVDFSMVSGHETATTDSFVLGNVVLVALQDNDLKQCGPNHNVQCNHAGIRMYVQSNTGLWNSTDNYGTPLLANGLSVGTSAANAAIVALYPVSPNQHAISLANFNPAKYLMTANFSQAGTGTYSATLVLEYYLY